MYTLQVFTFPYQAKFRAELLTKYKELGASIDEKFAPTKVTLRGSLEKLTEVAKNEHNHATAKSFTIFNGDNKAVAVHSNDPDLLFFGNQFYELPQTNKMYAKQSVDGILTD